jgi:hypothetical protein
MSFPSLCMRECVDTEFHAVLGALDSVLSTYWPSTGRFESVHGRMASVQVELDGLNATLRLFPLVGGTQKPVTELLLIVGAGRGDQAPAARRFLVDLVRLVENELQGTGPSPPYSALRL